MDQLAIGSIGLFLALSKFLNSKDDFGSQQQLGAPYGPNTPDEEMLLAIANKNNNKVRELFTRLTKADVQTKAKEYMAANCGDCEKMNWDNFHKQALNQFSDKPLTDYIHNNFVASQNVKQNMAGTEVRSGNYTLSNSGASGSVSAGFGNQTPYESKLGTFTGRDQLRPNKSDAHAPGVMFKANERNEGNVFGTPLTRPDTDRFVNPAGRRHDLKPCEAVQVGKGLGLAADVPGRSGFHEMHRVENRDLAAHTTRGQENTNVVPGRDTTQFQGPSLYSAGLLGDFSSKEGFGQKSDGGRAFVSKRCNTLVTTDNRPVVPGKHFLLGHSEQADHEHRGDTLRGTENTHTAFNSADVENAPIRYESYVSDKHNIKQNTTYTLPVHHGHRAIGIKSNDAYFNQTQRGENNERLQLGSKAGGTGTVQYTDSARTTLRQGSNAEGMGNAYGGHTTHTLRPEDDIRGTQRATEASRYNMGSLAQSGQTSVGAYHNSEGTARIHAEDRPAPGRGNVAVDNRKQMGTYHLNTKESTNSRSMIANTGTREGVIGQTQSRVKFEERTVRDPAIGRVGNQPYESVPLDTRIGCKEDPM